MADYNESTDAILGQEFLTWLWCKSDLAPAGFTDAENNTFSVSMEQRIVVQGGSGEAKETASVSGAYSPLTEARFGLGRGKQVVRALIHLEKDEMSFQVQLKAQDFTLSSMHTPKIERDKDAEEQDPDALLLEKIYFYEVALSLLDALFRQFLLLRFSDAWQTEVEIVRTWMSKAESVQDVS